MRNTKRKNSGFTIIEMLMALTITALLLTALAASINATMINFNANENSYKAINNARLALGRMCAQLRTSQGVDLDYAWESPSNCKFMTAEGKDVRYWRNPIDDKLYLYQDTKNYVLCDGVEDIVFTKSYDLADPAKKVRNVQISMTIKVGDITKKLSTATVVMINMP